MKKQVSSAAADSCRPDIFQMVTERIMTALQAGVIPWRKPWQGFGEPRNYASGHVYQSVNAFLLGLVRAEYPLFLTYKQAQSLGGQVRRGEKGMLILFYSKVAGKSKVTGEKEFYPCLKYSTVFNIAQIDGIAWELPEVIAREHCPVEAAEQVCATYLTELGGPTLHHEGDQALYRKSTDKVLMPAPESFATAEGYYATLFHEMAHSTGHAKRLNRPELVESSFFGSPNYAKEELTAEMTAAFLSTAAGLDISATLDNSAAYIENWLQALRADKTLVLTAASLAQKAAYHILGKEAPQYQATED